MCIVEILVKSKEAKKENAAIFFNTNVHAFSFHQIGVTTVNTALKPAFLFLTASCERRFMSLSSFHFLPVRCEWLYSH